MPKSLHVILASALALAACGRGQSVSSPPGKVFGPDPRSLNHDQLMAIFHECHEFGQIDDPRVKYSMQYCANVESAHASEGWTTPSTATVDPTLNKVH